MIWDSRIVPNPNRTPRLINSSISEIPVTISAFSMGILVIPIMMARFLFFYHSLAIQAIVPITVAMADDKKSDEQRVVKSFQNDAVLEKLGVPFQREASPFGPGYGLALKDRTINVTMGSVKEDKNKADIYFL